MQQRLLGIPVAALIGWIYIPAGSSINIPGINLLEEAAGISVTFLQWMSIGVPMAVLMIPFVWFIPH